MLLQEGNAGDRRATCLPHPQSLHPRAGKAASGDTNFKSFRGATEREPCNFLATRGLQEEAAGVKAVTLGTYLAA